MVSSQLGPRRVRVVRREPHDRHEVGAEVHRRVAGRRARGPGSAGSASGGRARPPHPGGSGPRARRRWPCRAPRRRRCSGRGRSSPPGRSAPGPRSTALRDRPRHPAPGSPCRGRRGARRGGPGPRRIASSRVGRLAVRAAGGGRRGPPPSPGPARSATARPPSSARSRPRAWKSAPRIVSTTLRPTPADQQTSIRVRSAGGDLTGVALAETQAAQPQPAPRSPAGATPGTAAACRAASCRTVAQHRLERGQPLVDVPADQELHGRAALQLERLGDRGVRARPRGRRGPRRPLGRRWPGRRPAARGGPSPGRPRGRAGAPARGGRAAAARSKASVSAACIGRPGEVLGRPFRQVRTQEVHAQHLGIGLARGLQHHRPAGDDARAPPPARAGPRRSRGPGRGRSRPRPSRARPVLRISRPARSRASATRSSWTSSAQLAQLHQPERPSRDRRSARARAAPRRGAGGSATRAPHPADSLLESAGPVDAAGRRDGRSRALARVSPAWTCRTSSATKNGLPPDSRTIASTSVSLVRPATGRSRPSSAMGQVAGLAGRSAVRRRARGSRAPAPGRVSSFARVPAGSRASKSAWRNGLVARSSLR